MADYALSERLLVVVWFRRPSRDRVLVKIIVWYILHCKVALQLSDSDTIIIATYYYRVVQTVGRHLPETL